MATGRMIARSLGRSKKYNQLPDHFTKLVYIHTLTGADEQGRIEADAIAIYGDYFVVDPEASLERIEAALDELHRVGLIQLYEADGKRYAQFADFDKHNTIRRDKDGNPTREARSRIPDPPTDCAETAQSPRSPRAVSTPQDKDQVQDQDQVEGESRALARDERAIEDTPEARFARTVATGKSEQAETARTRATIRRLAGAKFAREHEADMAAWSRHPTEKIEELWAASNARNWPGESGKRRTWLFLDLLNEDRYPPGQQPERPRNPYLAYAGTRGTLPGGQEFEVIAATTDFQKLITDVGKYLTPAEVDQYARTA